ncbi:hypothetical protein L596_011517 [Steinernema carpocapsae]|uniref:Uncharacterized protein n=1 Tax=Steinernema carpocapsae TaxID=34508 RepID=A0A4U5NV19_STECR|nr:hypothetical protein L596_011517 [Steinernema carpocapsae]
MSIISIGFTKRSFPWKKFSWTSTLKPNERSLNLAFGKRVSSSDLSESYAAQNDLFGYLQVRITFFMFTQTALF